MFVWYQGTCAKLLRVSNKLVDVNITYMQETGNYVTLVYDKLIFLSALLWDTQYK